MCIHIYIYIYIRMYICICIYVYLFVYQKRLVSVGFLGMCEKMPKLALGVHLSYICAHAHT